VDSISIIHSGRQTYYTKLGKEDYYTSEQEPEGRFHGRGAGKLGLAGQKIVEGDERLKELFLGTLDGQKLRRGRSCTKTYHFLEDRSQGIKIPLNKYSHAQIKSQNPEHYSKETQQAVKRLNRDNPHHYLTTKKQRPVLAYDHVFSAPKDVSILWATTRDPELKQSLLHAHHQAVAAARNYLDQHTVVRRGANGKQVHAAQATFAQFHHQVSRDGDPQLHDHVVQLNIGITDQGHTGAICGKTVLDTRYAAGMVYQNQLRCQIERQLGMTTYDRPFSDGKGVTFGIHGISPRVRQAFSQRNTAINERITSEMTGSQVRAEVLKTRAEKEHNTATPNLHQQWQERARELGFDPSRVQRTPEQQQETSPPPDPKARASEVATTLHIQTVAAREQKQQQAQAARTPAENNRQPDPPTISAAQVEVATLSANRGRTDSHTALQDATRFRRHFMKPAPAPQRSASSRTQTHTAPRARDRVTFNTMGIAAIGTAGPFTKARRLARACIGWHKWQRAHVRVKTVRSRRRRFQRGILFAYATGRLTRRQYLKLRTGPNQSHNVFVNRTKEALGLQTKRQSDYFIMRGKMTQGIYHPGPKYMQEEREIRRYYGYDPLGEKPEPPKRQRPYFGKDSRPPKRSKEAQVAERRRKKAEAARIKREQRAQQRDKEREKEQEKAREREYEP
jgi:conjugative relaxase-like TrwC/TraI family protein